MRQVVQSYRTGELEVIEVPPPQFRDGMVLIKTAYSVISAGTEKSKIDTAKRTLVGKALLRPDLVRQVVEKSKRDGLWKTWRTVSHRLNSPVPLGYSSAGIVLATAGDTDGLKPGQFVACGGDRAQHAEIVAVPKNLVVRVPEGVEPRHAAFATIGAIAMQSVRQADVQIGQRIAVVGLGLIGLLVVQILRASGCKVIGIDVDPAKLPIAARIGCEQVVLARDDTLETKVLAFTAGHGVDATIIAAGTRSNRPIEQAGEITRERGKVVVLGAVGLNIPREPYYLKEIELRLSRSYGPGRYDRNYEEKGNDYPFAYVRFTEQRNMECFLELVKGGQVDLEPIITHQFSIEEADQAYSLVQGNQREQYLGILLEYHRHETEIPSRIQVRASPLTDRIKLGVIGAGNYAIAHLLPHLQAHPAILLASICNASGLTARDVATKFGFQAADSRVDKIITESDAILIATRHSDHARYALQALRQKKPIFVEKPLVLRQEELEEFTSLQAQDNQGTIMVGFNRRFSPALEMVKHHFRSTELPKQILIRVNAGAIPPDHWIHDPVVGGGRLIGEACHFVDLIVALTGAAIRTVSATAIPKANSSPALWDDFCISLGLSDGSVGTIVYASDGDSGLAKERIEVFSGGKAAIIHDFEGVELWANGKRYRKWRRQDKGQKRQIQAWINGLREGRSPIPVTDIINVHQACFAAIKSIRDCEVVRI